MEKKVDSKELVGPAVLYDSKELNDFEREVKSMFHERRFEDVVGLFDSHMCGVFWKNLDEIFFLALLECNRIDEAYSRWVVGALNLSFAFIEKKISTLPSDEVLARVIQRLSSERFDMKALTSLDNLMYRLYRQNRQRYNFFLKLIKKYRIRLQYYTAASNGLIEELELSFAKELLASNNKKLILRVFSDRAYHQKNMKFFREHRLARFIDHQILSQAFEKLQRQKIEDQVTAVNKRPLKIAICISGQLRGFSKTRDSFNLIGLEKHDVDYYVCVWRDIGRKRPHGNKHLDRIFTPNVAQAFSDILTNQHHSFFDSHFTNLSDYLNKKEDVTHKELCDVYGTKNVKIMEDGDFSFMNNNQKMYMMINRCWTMIKNPAEYDLIVRIRPDKEIKSFDLDLNYFSKHYSNDTIIADKTGSIHTDDVFMGDQFAMSGPKVMEIYSSTFTRCFERKGVFKFDEYSELKPHTSLCASMLYEDVNIIDGSNYIKFGELIDPKALDLNLLRKLIDEDSKNLNSELIDAIHCAIERDEKNLA